MKPVLIIFLFSILHIAPIFAEKFSDLNQEEKQIRREKLKKFNRDTFVNRSNEKADEETRKADYEAGKKLSQNLQSSQKEATARGITIRRVPSGEDGKNGGDILEFTDTVYFGHVNTIVRIITGLIKETYGYTQEDSELLALYSVYYNLKHRQDEPYFQSNFIDKLLTTTTREKIGLDENFEEWRGKTQFVIPIEKNILNKSGFDVATFELEDQVSTELDFHKDAVETKKKYSNLQNKKIKVEKEESQKRLISTRSREVEIIQKNNSIEEKLKELRKDPDANKEELAKLEAEKQKIDEEKSRVEEEKKTFEKKTVQVNQRDEMRKIGITSEKEYKEAVKNKKLPEIYVDPVTSEVKSKGTMSQEYALMKEKNTPKEPYTGSANSVGIPSTRNRILPIEKDGEKLTPEAGLSTGATSSTGEQQGIGKNLNSLQSMDGKNTQNKTGTQQNRGNTGSGSGTASDFTGMGEIPTGIAGSSTGGIDKPGSGSKTGEGRYIQGTGNSGTEGQKSRTGSDETKSGVTFVVRNGVDGKPENSDGRSGKPDGSQGAGNGTRDTLGGSRDGSDGMREPNAESLKKGSTGLGVSENANGSGKVSVSITRNESNSPQSSNPGRTGNPLQDALNDQIAALSNSGKGADTRAEKSQTSNPSGSNSVLKIGDDSRKKVTIKVISEYNLAFHAARLNISAREFIKAPETGYIVIGRKLPVKSEDLGLFLLDVQELDLRGNANGIVLHKNSPLMYYYNRIIVYEKYNNSVYLTQLNMNLKVDFRSPQPIDPDTSITIEGDTISLMRYNPQENAFQSSLYKLSDFSPITE